MTETKHKLDVWETPSDYAGYDPVGHYGVIGMNRDSKLLDRVNWDVALERMAKAAGIEVVPNLADAQPDRSIMLGGDPDAAPDVYWWEASHWACGWVRYLMVKPDAPEAVLDAAEGIRSDFASYPILDDDRFMEAEQEAVEKEWAETDPSDRLEWYIRPANKQGASIPDAAAADNDLPEDDSGSLYELLREGL